MKFLHSTSVAGIIIKNTFQYNGWEKLLGLTLKKKNADTKGFFLFYLIYAENNFLLIIKRYILLIIKAKK